MYGIALIPLLIFGIYKNGIQLYDKGYVNVWGMIKPVILISMAICGSVAGTLLKNYRQKKIIDLESMNKCKKGIIEALLLSFVLPIKSSPLILFVVTFLFNLFKENTKINKVAIMYIVMQLLNVLLGLNTFSNPYEVNTTLNYDGIDLFLGFGTGGICSTPVVFIILGLIILCFNSLYKKDMVISAIITFLILGIVPRIITSHYGEIFPLIFGYNILYVFVFIFPNLYSSSYTTKGQILSGIIFAILTYFFVMITPYNAAMLSVILVSLIRGICDRLFVIKLRSR